jgi:hypothetical protein
LLRANGFISLFSCIKKYVLLFTIFVVVVVYVIIFLFRVVGVIFCTSVLRLF